MYCPACGEKGPCKAESWPIARWGMQNLASGGFQRLRECEFCGHRFVTCEVPLEDLDHLTSRWTEDLDMVARRLKRLLGEVESRTRWAGYRRSKDYPDY